MPAVLFDFFGTLVEYDPSRTAQGYPRAHAVLQTAGIDLPYDTWLGVWDEVAFRLDAEADAAGVEFSMRTFFTAFAAAAGFDDDGELATAFLRAYIEEWCAPVRLIDGVPALLAGLRGAGHRLALVSNTHDAAMVRHLLDRFGIAGCFDAVVTSVEHGRRKPHPSIYLATLEAVGTDQSDAVFVGDSHVPDYAGPRALGLEAFLLIGPDGEAPDDVPADRRLRSVVDLGAALGLG